MDVGQCECGCGQPTRLSRYNDAPRGYVKGVPMRFVQGHNNRGRAVKPVRYVEEDRGYATPCWIWQLSLDGGGYPHGGPRTGKSGHVVYYERAKGPVPAGMHVDHLCRVRACVNPDHLEAVTPAENVRRASGAKLTYDDVDEIRSLRARGMKQGEVAQRYGVHRVTISDIEHGRTWVAIGGVA